MTRFKLLLSWLFICLCPAFAIAQTNIRPTVPLPNGFEVNSYTGNLYQSRTDLTVPTQGFLIDITFSFNASRTNRDWGYGKGWTFTYNMAYTADQSGVTVERADGRRDIYKKNGSIYIAPTGVFDALVEYQSGQFYLETKSGLRYYFNNASHKRLTAMQDPNGNRLEFAYSDTLLQSITSSASHSLQFSWTNGHLSKINDQSCTPERQITYGYDSEGRTEKVTNPLGDFVQYQSDTASRLTDFTDEGGNSMNFTYNKNGAAVTAISCATYHSFRYLTQQRKTYVTERVNGQSVITTYNFDTQGRVVAKKGNCCGFNLEYQYDEHNNVTSIIDGNKKVFKYEYDSKGNVTKQIDPDNNVTAFVFEPVFNKVTSLTDKLGNATTYAYDSRGNLTQTDKPTGITEKSTYDSKGNAVTFTDGNGNSSQFEYNVNGHLVKITDAEGAITTYTTDCYGNRLTETDPLGNTTVNVYNVFNQLTKSTNALGYVTSYTYNKLRLLASETNGLGKKTEYHYDGLGRQTSLVMPMGNASHKEYDAQGNLTKQTDAKGNVTRYTYNNRKQPLSVTDPLGNTVFYEYDEAGNKLAETDKRGNTTRFEYDNLYRLTRVVDPQGGAVTYSYDAMGRRTGETDANGHSRSFEYDAMGRLTKSIDALNQSASYTYDHSGNRLTEKDRNGNTTTHTYDKANRLLSSTNALGNVITYTYDLNGNVLTEKDPLNRLKSYLYDKLERQVQITDAEGDITKFTYDAANNQRTITAPNGNVTTNNFNANNQIITAVDDVGTISEFTYDDNENVSSEKDGNGNKTSYEYDALNRVTKTIFQNNTTFQFAYDANGNKTTETDQKGNVTSFQYDKLNRTTVINDALNQANSFHYDAKGNLTSLVDAKGNTTSYQYDSRDQVVKQTYADGSTKTFTYNSNELLVEKVSGAGAPVTYKYDQLNRLTERGYAGNNSDTFEYDAAGYLTKAANSNAVVTFEYDRTGKLLKETNGDRVTGYAYNTSERTKAISYPGGTQLSWLMDGRGRLKEIKEENNQLAKLDYDAAGRLTGKQFRNGVNTVYTYDGMNNLTSLKTSAGSVQDIVYSYDESDKRILTERKHKPSRSEKYTYDNTYQLRSFVSGQYENGNVTPALSHEYTYDALGNRQTVKDGNVDISYTVNNLNQYTSVNANGVNAPPAYDSKGNLENDGTNSYQYDQENRLIGIQNAQYTVTYKYDALGRRASRTLDGVETLHSYDVDNLIEESTAGVTKSYFYGDEVDQILASRSQSTLYFYHTDNLNTVHALTDGSGALAEYYLYDPFGTPHVYSPTDVELSTSTINNLLYTGRQYEFAFGTYNYRNREMTPKLGRFAQRDPLEYIDGLNAYAYVGNNVLNASDPYGLVDGWAVAGAVGGLVWNSIGLAASSLAVISGVGTLPGVVGVGYFGYGYGASIANLAAALADEPAPSTGAAIGDAARHFFPCDEGVQLVGQGLDMVIGITGVGATAGKTGRIIGSAGKESSGLKPLGLGATGRTVPGNLSEQLAMKEAMANPSAGRVIMEGMTDKRWNGWNKLHYSRTNPDGSKTVIHYVGKFENGILTHVDDFKFK